MPDELTTYIYLEKLLLSQNVIKSVPDGVGGLQSLTYLDLRYVLALCGFTKVCFDPVGISE